MPHNPLLTPARHGFTLVEMSIVLAIIGVLMGGMLSLQNYTRNAKIKTVMNESKAMISAYNQFQTQYSAIPGDYIAASNAWTGAGNGDGNGVIRATGTNPGNRNEYFYSFQHLSRSGFIAGAYTGTTSGGGGTYYARIGINVPGNAMERGAFLFDHPDVLDGFATADIYYFDGNYGNVLRIASLSDNANSVPNEGILTPKQAFMVDTKYDDGMPGLGTIVAPKNSAVGSCVTSDVAATATYVTTSNDAKNCIIIVKIQ